MVWETDAEATARLAAAARAETVAAFKARAALLRRDAEARLGSRATRGTLALLQLKGRDSMGSRPPSGPPSLALLERLARAASAADVEAVRGLAAEIRDQLEAAVPRRDIVHPDVGRAAQRALEAAVRAGSGPCTAEVVSLGLRVVDPNARGRDGFTVLHAAVAAGAEDVVRTLVAHPDVDVNASSAHGFTPLALAATRFNLRGGARGGRGERGRGRGGGGERGSSSSSSKGRRDYAGCLRLLLDHPGLDVNQMDWSGWTALARAADEGQAEAVGMLLSHPDTAVNEVRTNGWTALASAACRGHAEVVRVLLQAPEVNVRRVDEDGYGPLFLAAGHGHAAVVALLLAEGERLDVNVRNRYGETPLFEASSQGHRDVVNLLLADPRVDPLLPDRKEMTPADAAEEAGHAEVASLLRKRERQMEGKSPR